MAKSNTTYEGTESLDSQGPYMKWLIKGDSDNWYYHKNDTLQTPRRLKQGTHDVMDYTSYKVGITDPKVFDLPSYCTDKCGATTACSILRKDNL